MKVEKTQEVISRVSNRWVFGTRDDKFSGSALSDREPTDTAAPLISVTIRNEYNGFSLLAQDLPELIEFLQGVHEELKKPC